MARVRLHPKSTTSRVMHGELEGCRRTTEVKQSFRSLTVNFQQQKKNHKSERNQVWCICWQKEVFKGKCHVYLASDPLAQMKNTKANPGSKAYLSFFFPEWSQGLAITSGHLENHVFNPAFSSNRQKRTEQSQSIHVFQSIETSSFSYLP